MIDTRTGRIVFNTPLSPSHTELSRIWNVGGAGVGFTLTLILSILAPVRFATTSPVAPPGRSAAPLPAPQLTSDAMCRPTRITTSDAPLPPVPRIVMLLCC